MLKDNETPEDIPASPLANTPYLLALERAVTAALTLSMRTDDLVLMFKGPTDSEFVLIVERNCVFINDK